VSGATKGGRDFLKLGTWNLMCAYCGRKRKADELVIDDQFARGLLVCKEHRDLRHPQEFARGIKEDMTVPKVQPPIVAFTSLPASFPLFIEPNPVVLLSGVINLATEASGDFLLTESGIEIVTETAFTAFVVALFPPWISPFPDPFGVYITSIAWSWFSGGTGIMIGPVLDDVVVELQALTTGLSGVLQVVATNSLGQTATAKAQVNS
jgi:hypothetical protein